MGIFDIFKPSQREPSQIAPHVTERPAMTNHQGKIINSALICWIVHQYIVDTISGRLIYDKYHKCQTEAAARALCNSLKCQHLPGGHQNLVDYWGEYAEASFQAGLTEAREKASQDFTRQLELLRAKKVEDLDKLQKRYLETKQERDTLRRQLEALMEAQSQQIDEETAKAANQATAQIQKDFKQFKLEAREAASNVVRVLTLTESEQVAEVKRLARQVDGMDGKEPPLFKLIAYYLAPLAIVED